VYGGSHLHRLVLIGRLQKRGYSLSGIRDLLDAWRDGDDLGDVLGLMPDQLVHIEEPGAPATMSQLELLLPALVPARMPELLASGVVERCGDQTYCVPSPSLLQLAVDASRTGYTPDAVLQLLDALGAAAISVATAAVAALAQRPADAAPDDFLAFATRARGLLAHGTGRLTIHALGRELGITDEADVAAGLRRLVEADGR
jgi:DNA-binding transcriptional MerR regulator